ncbi:MAG TPA: glutamate--tRNA ligase [Acidimicrobiales bacterium]
MTSPRVRFSPAPTGYLHVGSARAALYNWLYARHSGGSFLVRIEDTDTERNRPELIDSILDALRWLGLDWDEEPVRQSDQAGVHRKAVAQLLADGHAYHCSCTTEEVQARAKARGGPPGYDGHCRDRGLDDGPGVVVRFRTPDEGSTGWSDVVRGPVSFANADLEDFVIRRSNGTPTFLVANALDDVHMGITHVIRGEDLVSATPKGILLRQATGSGELPVYAHLPLLVNEQRKKLSKRRDDVSVSDYRDRGYLASAMVNYLALLGWGPPDEVEVRPVSEIIELFELEAVSKSPAFFDVKKLTHINAEHIRMLAVEKFTEAVTPHLTGSFADRFDPARFARIAPLVQERTHLLTDVVELVDFLFVDEVEIVDADWVKAVTDIPAATLLDAVVASFSDCDWTRDALHRTLAEVGERHGLKLGKAQAPVRVSVTGRRVGPPLFEALEILGRDEVLKRVAVGRARLG